MYAIDIDRIEELQRMLNAELAKHDEANEDLIFELAEDIEQMIFFAREERFNTLKAS